MIMTTNESALPITPRRLEALRQVQRHEVSYDPGLASYFVGGLQVGGWDGRTFSELQQSDLIKLPSGRSLQEVELSTQGERIVSAGRIDPSPLD